MARGGWLFGDPSLEYFLKLRTELHSCECFKIKIQQDHENNSEPDFIRFAFAPLVVFWVVVFLDGLVNKEYRLLAL